MEPRCSKRKVCDMVSFVRKRGKKGQLKAQVFQGTTWGKRDNRLQGGEHPCYDPFKWGGGKRESFISAGGGGGRGYGGKGEQLKHFTP